MRPEDRAPRAGVAAARLVAFLVALLAACLFALRARHGYDFLPFGDEAGHVLGAVAIHHGDVLYRGYIAAHGPATFMLLHLWGVLFGFRDLQSMRLVPVLAALAAAFCVAAGAAPSVESAGAAPSVESAGAARATESSAAARRLIAAAIFLGGIAAVWIVQGLYLVSYFTLGGAFAVAGIALFAWPAIASTGSRRAPVARVPAFVAGVAASMAIFTAIAFAPPVLIVALAGMVAGAGIRPFLAGLAFGTAANAAWLALFGDPVGFYVFHYLTNRVDYAPYTHAGPLTALRSLVPSANPARLVQTLCVLAFLLAALLSPWRSGGRRVGGLVLLLIGVLGLDARGLVLFQDGAFLMAAFALLALALARAIRPILPLAAIALAFVAAAELTARHALSTPSGLTRAELGSQPFVPLGRRDDPESERVRALSGPNDRVLALPYHPEFFLWADRLPVEKYHDYLPWEADYARHPSFGRTRDLCVDLPRDMPKVIWFDDWRVWNLYAPERYMPCVIALLHARYRQDPRFPHLWIRQDLAGR